MIKDGDKWNRLETINLTNLALTFWDAQAIKYLLYVTRVHSCSIRAQENSNLRKRLNYGQDGTVEDLCACQILSFFWIDPH